MTQDPRETAVRALLAQGDRPRPDAAFASRLRAQFVAGSIPQTRPTPRTLAPQWWLVPLAAAALLLLWLNRPVGDALPWRVQASSGLEYVLLDGQRMPVDGLEQHLAPGRVLSLPASSGARLDLVCDGMFYVRLENGVRWRLPRREGSEIDGELSGDGSFSVVTGPDFQGQRWRLASSTARWDVSGTAFTAIVGDQFLCLCVLEGTVEVGLHGASMEAVPAGGRFTVMPDLPEPDRGDIVPAEREFLSELTTRAAEVW